jgi:hypothetical protein
MYVEQCFRRARRVDVIVGVPTSHSFKIDAQNMVLSRTVIVLDRPVCFSPRRLSRSGMK